MGFPVAGSNAFKSGCCSMGSGLWVLMNLVSVFYKLSSYLLHPSALLHKDGGGDGLTHLHGHNYAACNFKLLMKVDPRYFHTFEVEQLRSR